MQRASWRDPWGFSHATKRHGRVIITIPFPCLLPVVSLRVCRVPGDRRKASPCDTLLSVKLPLFLLRELLVGNVFLHSEYLLMEHRIQHGREQFKEGALKEFKSFYKIVSGSEGNRCMYNTRLDTYGRGCMHDCSYCYDGRWRKARMLFLEAHPLCAECLKSGRYVKATVVDHIIPHRGDQKLFWDQSNWQALCKPCHDHKTMTEDRWEEYKY